MIKSQVTSQRIVNLFERMLWRRITGFPVLSLLHKHLGVLAFFVRQSEPSMRWMLPLLSCRVNALTGSEIGISRLDNALSDFVIPPLRRRSRGGCRRMPTNHQVEKGPRSNREDQALTGSWNPSYNVTDKVHHRSRARAGRRLGRHRARPSRLCEPGRHPRRGGRQHQKRSQPST